VTIPPTRPLHLVLPHESVLVLRPESVSLPDRLPSRRDSNVKRRSVSRYNRTEQLLPQILSPPITMLFQKEVEIGEDQNPRFRACAPSTTGSNHA